MSLTAVRKYYFGEGAVVRKLTNKKTKWVSTSFSLPLSGRSLLTVLPTAFCCENVLSSGECNQHQSITVSAHGTKITQSLLPGFLNLNPCSQDLPHPWWGLSPCSCCFIIWETYHVGRWEMLCWLHATVSESC